MFQFKVVSDGEFREAQIIVKSDIFSACFTPLAYLPEYDKIDVNVPKCELVFCTDDGYVGLEWDEKEVRIQLSNFSTLEVGVKKSLLDWIKYEQEEDIFNQKTQQIEDEKEKALKSVIVKKVIKRKKSSESQKIEEKAKKEMESFGQGNEIFKFMQKRLSFFEK